LKTSQTSFSTKIDVLESKANITASWWFEIPCPVLAKVYTYIPSEMFNYCEFEAVNSQKGLCRFKCYLDKENTSFIWFVAEIYIFHTDTYQIFPVCTYAKKDKPPSMGRAERTLNFRAWSILALKTTIGPDNWTVNRISETEFEKQLKSLSEYNFTNHLLYLPSPKLPKCLTILFQRSIVGKTIPDIIWKAGIGLLDNMDEICFWMEDFDGKIYEIVSLLTVKEFGIKENKLIGILRPNVFDFTKIENVATEVKNDKISLKENRFILAELGGWREKLHNNSILYTALVTCSAIHTSKNKTMICYDAKTTTESLGKLIKGCFLW